MTRWIRVIIFIFSSLLGGACPAAQFQRTTQPSEVNLGQRYFAVDKCGLVIAREEHAKNMQFYGYSAARELLSIHKNLVPAQSGVWEIGPYENVLGGELAQSGHPWVVCEYDATTILELLKLPNPPVIFQADLKSFGPQDWSEFAFEHRRLISQITKKDRFGAAILSSVLNYFDYQKALDAIVPLVDGLLVITNSNKGDDNLKQMYLGGLASAEPILEYLLSRYGRRLILQEGSYLSSGLGERFIALAATVAPADLPEPPDHYRTAIGFIVDNFTDQSIPAITALISSARKDAFDYQHRHHSRFHIAGYENEAGIARWAKAREYLIDLELEAREMALWRLAMDDLASPAWQNFTSLLKAKVGVFLPEREIITQALAIPRSERRSFLNERLGHLYFQLGHPAPNFLAAPPTDPLLERYTDDFILRLLGKGSHWHRNILRDPRYLAVKALYESH